LANAHFPVGLLDSGLRQPGKIVFGSGDADFDIGSNNTLRHYAHVFYQPDLPSFSEGHHIFFSMSSDQGVHWTPAVVVNVAPATTAIFPWIAAHAGTVDVVYYATAASSKNDASVECVSGTNDG